MARLLIRHYDVEEGGGKRGVKDTWTFNGECVNVNE